MTVHSLPFHHLLTHSYRLMTTNQSHYSVVYYPWEPRAARLQFLCSMSLLQKNSGSTNHLINYVYHDVQDDVTKRAGNIYQCPAGHLYCFDCFDSIGGAESQWYVGCQKLFLYLLLCYANMEPLIFYMQPNLLAGNG